MDFGKVNGVWFMFERQQRTHEDNETEEPVVLAVAKKKVLNCMVI